MSFKNQASRLAICASAFAAIGSALAGPALAQNASDAESGELVVTGTRIQTPGFTAPTPVTALSNEQLLQASPTTVADALRTLPSLVNMSGPQRNPGTANGGQSFLNLRSLGSTRTLTLFDGHRFVSGALGG